MYSAARGSALAHVRSAAVASWAHLLVLPWPPMSAHASSSQAIAHQHQGAAWFGTSSVQEQLQMPLTPLHLQVAAQLGARPAAAWHKLGAAFSPLRSFSEGLRTGHADMSEAEFHRAADTTLDLLHERLEAYVEDLDLDDSDVEYSQGVLTVNLGKMGTFVINKQTPNRQIWLSSPVSGPFRFDYSSGKWVYHRDNRCLVLQLEQELAQLTGKQLSLKT